VPPTRRREFAATYRRTRPAYQEHEGAKADLKKLVPEDAKEAIGHGCRPNVQNRGPSALTSSIRCRPMHRSSETIGALAAALAKAQGDDCDLIT
jgi:hypothetical protein